MITVFTPTYNRQETLTRLYESLIRQTFTDFEWLIVDDGSTDESKALIDTFMKKTNSFPVRYVYQENGGKHRAINRGVNLAAGELFYIVDSDDWLPENALEILWTYYKTIQDNEQFAGVCGCRYDKNGVMLGTSFDGQWVDATSNEKEKFHISGDKAEAYKTSILKRYPFPEFEGENFLPEGIVWCKIANEGYQMRWFNENIYFCEYRPDGLTRNLQKKYRENPIGQLSDLKSVLYSLDRKGWRKYVLIGSRVALVDRKKIPKKKIQELAGITDIQYRVSQCLFSCYRLVRKILGKPTPF